jgi:hypothetical protein
MAFCRRSALTKENTMNKPSSTITASALAGMGVSVAWELVATFTEVDISAGLIGASTIFAASAVGYFKKENVLPVGN